MIEVTPRQLELLALYASGYSTVEIATMKFLSVRAVESHFAAARRRTEAKTLTNLCAICVDAGMIFYDGTMFRPAHDPEVVGE